MPVFRTSALTLLLLVYCEPALSCVDAHFYCRSDYAASGKCSDHRRLACLLTCSNCAPSCARLVAPPPYPPPPYPPGSGDCADLCSTAKNEVCETKATLAPFVLWFQLPPDSAASHSDYTLTADC